VPSQTLSSAQVDELRYVHFGKWVDTQLWLLDRRGL